MYCIVSHFLMCVKEKPCLSSKKRNSFCVALEEEKIVSVRNNSSVFVSREFESLFGLFCQLDYLPRVFVFDLSTHTCSSHMECQTPV